MEAKYFGLTKLKDQMYDTFGLRSYCRIMPSVILKEKKEKNVQHNKFNLIWEWKIVMYVRYLEICFMDVLYIIKQFRTNSISVNIRIYRGTCKKVLLLDERAWAEWRVIWLAPNTNTPALKEIFNLIVFIVRSHSHLMKGDNVILDSNSLSVEGTDSQV